MAARKKKARGVGGGKRPAISREAYALARAQGKSRSEAAVLAGSKARSVEARCNAAARLEAEPGMFELMAVARENVIRGMEDTWEKAQARMAQMLDHPKWQARTKAADFTAKVVGGYAAQKVEHSGVVESTPVGGLADLDADERAALRAILQKRKAKKP